MADSVNIPISMIVDDIQIDQSAVDKMTDHLDKVSSTVVKDANKVLGGIDPTKMTEKMTKSFDNTVKKVTDLNQAIRAYSIAQKQAGRSSTEYRALARRNTQAIEAERESYGNMLSVLTDSDLGRRALSTFQENGIGGNPLAGNDRFRQFNDIYARIEDITRDHNETMARLTAETPNPLDFISTGSETSINTLIKAYERVVEAVTAVSKANGQFEQSTQSGQFTEEYNERIATIQKLAEKMDKLNEKSKKMETLGASDNAWEALRYDMSQIATEMTSLIRGAQQMNKAGTNMQLGPDVAAMKEQSKLLSDMQRKVTALKTAMNTRADKNETPYTKEYVTQLQEIEKVKREIDKLVAKEKEMQALGADRAHWDKFAYDVQVLNTRMDDAVGRAQDLVDAGKAFRFGGDAAAEMQKLEEEANTLRYTLNQLENTDPNIKQNFFMALRAMKATSEMATTLKKKINGLWVAFKNLFKHASKGTVDLQGGFKKLLRSIMMFGLGFRSTYYLVKQLRKTVTEELGYMAKAFPEVNKMMSEFKTSLNQLKGQFGAAFLPIMQIVIPALEALISALNRACEAIARFFSILAGKSTFKKFTSDAIDYKDALEGAGGAAKDLKNSVMGFDELNKLNDDSGGGGGSGSARGSWEDAPAVSEFAEMLKSAWAGADFTEVGVMLGHKMVDALHKATEWMKSKGQTWARNLGTSIATLINGFFGVDEVGTSIGEAIAAAINMAITFLHTFLSGTNWKLVGEQIGIAISTAIRDINWDMLGVTLADGIRAAIQFAFGLVSEIKFDQLGQKIADGINGFFTRMGEVDPVTGLSGWQEAGAAFNKLATGILEAIKKAVGNIHWDEVGTAIGEFISSMDWSRIIIDFTKLAGEIVKGIGEALANWSKTDPISFGIAALIGTALVGIDLTGKVAKTGAMILPILNQFQQLSGTTLPFFSNFVGLLTKLGGGLSLVSGLFLAITNIISMFTGGVNGANAALTIVGTTLAGLGVMLLFGTGPIGILVGAIAGAVAVIVALVVNNWDTIKAWFVQAWADIKDWFSGVWEFIKTEAETLWGNLKSLFTGIITFITGPVVVGITAGVSALVGVFQGLWHSIQEIWNGIKEIFSGIITFVTGVFTGNWRQAWEGVKMIFKGIFDALVGIVKAPLNMIIGLINGMLSGISAGVNFVIDKVNGMSFKVPDWVPAIGGKNFGFNLKKMSVGSIPYLAQGAVIPPNNEFLAMLGDQKHGTNIEAPLDTIVEAVREAFGGGAGGEINVTVVTTLDGREVARNTVKHIKLMERSGAYA